MFSQQIKLLRSSHDLTQVEFAKVFSIATGTIAMWETGKRQPDYETLVKLADYFDVPADYLLGRGLFEEWGKIMANKSLVVDAFAEVFATFPIKFDELTEDQLIKLLPALAKKITIDDGNVSIDLLRI